MVNLGDFESTREQLDKVSPSLCLAKWLQVTLHLHNGLTHSCHHPQAHKIPLDEIKNNPSALHNTIFKKEQRKKMLEGTRPSECSYCWNIEDCGKKNISDRLVKSNDSWANPFFNEVIESPWDKDINPKYLEVSFSHHCNFKCSYCSPFVSSKWTEEIKNLGPYTVQNVDYNSMTWQDNVDRNPIPIGTQNPYVDAFWAWWPSLYPELKVLRVTGGEPLLSPDTFNLLDYISEHPHNDLDVAINTNLGVTRALIDKLIDRSSKILAVKSVKELSIYTSVDTWGAHAEYIRHGLNFNYFWGNLTLLLTKLPQIKITIMCTYNVLSVPKFHELLENVLEMKSRFQNRLILDISYLHSPSHQSPQIITPEYFETLKDDLQFMKSNAFFDYEVMKFERLVEMITSFSDDTFVSINQAAFFHFFTEHDKRRNTNFQATFPELSAFWKECSRQSHGYKMLDFINAKDSKA